MDNLFNIINLSEECSKIISNNHYPFFAKNIIQELGGNIIYVENVEYDIKITKENEFTIFINKAFNRYNENMILAISLGYLFLNLNYLTNDWIINKECIISYRYGVTSDIYKSYIFATHLLMPYNIFYRYSKKYSDENNKVNITEMSKRFDIDKQIIEAHGKYLGIFYY